PGAQNRRRQNRQRKRPAASGRDASSRALLKRGLEWRSMDHKRRLVLQHRLLDRTDWRRRRPDAAALAHGAVLAPARPAPKSGLSFPGAVFLVRRLAVSPESAVSAPPARGWHDPPHASRSALR